MLARITTTGRILRLVVIALASHADVEFSVARSVFQNALTRRELASREDSDRPTGRVRPEGKSRASAPPIRLAGRTAQNHPLSWLAASRLGSGWPTEIGQGEYTGLKSTPTGSAFSAPSGRGVAAEAELCATRCGAFTAPESTHGVALQTPAFAPHHGHDAAQQG